MEIFCTACGIFIVLQEDAELAYSTSIIHMESIIRDVAGV